MHYGICINGLFDIHTFGIYIYYVYLSLKSRVLAPIKLHYGICINGLFDIHNFGIYRYCILELEVLGIGPNQDALWDMYKWSI